LFVDFEECSLPDFTKIEVEVEEVEVDILLLLDWASKSKRHTPFKLGYAGDDEAD
jgi:hypothetical protein